MMRAILVGLGLMALLGCGVDGEPVRPSVNSGGIHTSVGTGVRVGGVNLGVGLGL